MREADAIEEKALVYLQLEQSVYHRSVELYQRDAEAVRMAQESYEAELVGTWTKDQLPLKSLTR